MSNAFDHGANVKIPPALEALCWVRSLVKLDLALVAETSGLIGGQGLLHPLGLFDRRLFLFQGLALLSLNTPGCFLKGGVKSTVRILASTFDPVQKDAMTFFKCHHWEEWSAICSFHMPELVTIRLVKLVKDVFHCVTMNAHL